jgi:hypothetical protein
VTPHATAILNAADRLAAGRGLSYRERLQVERGVFHLTAANVMREFGWPLQSMGTGAHDELVYYCQRSNVPAENQGLAAIELGFDAMRLISSIANADPYVLNENISRVVHRYSTGVATLPRVLRELVAAQRS